MSLNTDYMEQARAWLGLPGLDPDGKKELEDLVSAAENGDHEAIAEISDRFYRDLEFGTGGMRGVMGEGRNRMNVTMIRRASQGYAEHIIADAAERGVAEPKAAVAYDSRKFSDLFAFETACVFVANGIRTVLYDRLSATPLLSWTIRKLNADGGVVVTASHNPKEYNGYKIYDHTGCQCLTEQANDVIARIEATDPVSGIKTVAGNYSGSPADRMAAAAAGQPLLTLLGEDNINEFIEVVLNARLRHDKADNVSVVYTPLNGAGNYPVRSVLSRIGVGSVRVVPEQENPDASFATCPFPNPEKTEALELGFELCSKYRLQGDPPDVLIGTDPDCDRLGCAVFDGNDYVQLSGDRVGVLLFDYIVETRREKGLMPARPVLVTTIVSSPLAVAIARANGVEAWLCLTGFKHIGYEINKLGLERGNTDDFIFGYEESCGYLTQPHVRDKDAVNAAMMLCELISYHKSQGKTVFDRLEELFRKYGYYSEGLAEFVRPGEKGMQEIARDMELARRATESDFGKKITGRVDYLKDATGLPESDVVQYDFEDGSRVLFRPSGTEPKLKIYFSVRAASAEASSAMMEEFKENTLKLFPQL